MNRVILTETKNENVDKWHGVRATRSVNHLMERDRLIPKTND